MVEHRRATFHERTGIWILAAANGISQAGNTITFLAVPWFVLQTTDSASRTGLVSTMFAVAVIASGLTIGTLVDRMGYRRMSVLADALSGMTVLAIPVLYFSDLLPFWLLLALVLLGAYFDTPARTARSALTPALAQLSRMPLERANSVYRGAVVVGDTILGPLLFGALTIFMRPVNVLFVDAGTFAVSVLMIALLIRTPTRALSEAGGEAQEESGIEAFLAGFRFVLRDQVVGVIQPIAALYSFVLIAYFGVILPVYVDEVFDDAAYLALLIAALGSGTLVGTIAYGSIGVRYRRYASLVATSVVSAAALWLFTLTTYLASDIFAIFVFGLAGGPFNPIMRTIVQERAPERALGRVLNALFTSVAIAGTLGTLVAGFAISEFGVRTIQVSAAVLITLVPLWFAFAPWPRRAAPAFEE